MSRPEIRAVSQDLKNWILRLPEVVEAPHKFGGTQFQVNGLEFMHFHGDTFLEIRLSKEDQAIVLKQGTAIPHRFAPQAGWVSFRIDNAEDVESQECHSNGQCKREKQGSSKRIECLSSH